MSTIFFSPLSFSCWLQNNTPHSAQSTHPPTPIHFVFPSVSEKWLHERSRRRIVIAKKKESKKDVLIRRGQVENRYRTDKIVLAERKGRLCRGRFNPAGGWWKTPARNRPNRRRRPPRKKGAKPT
uniref:(northern house mosquito) hypothetical protein n=2 Tax=Culex pipiens TaxID=7175 RepID=A0A8D8I8R2_CULPI